MKRLFVFLLLASNCAADSGVIGAGSILRIRKA